MPDHKVASDEARRASQHERVKSWIERDVDAEITSEADRRAGADADRVERVAADLRDKALHEVMGTEHEIHRGRVTARLSQVVDYLFAIVYALLGVRLLLALMAARPSAPFVQWIQAMTDPLYAPFRGIAPSLAVQGGYTLALPVLFAILMYIIAHAGIRGLLRLIAHRRTHV